jgi:hypothetical protein
MECVDSKGDARMKIVRTHQHNINSTIVQTARSLNRELRRGTKQRKDIVADKKKKMAREKDAWTMPTWFRRKTGG